MTENIDVLDPDKGMSGENVHIMYKKLKDAERLVAMSSDLTRPALQIAVDIIAEVKTFMATWLHIQQE